jgi:hypothetical protein
MVVKTAKGFQIKSHRTGKIYPKIYRTRKEAEKRIKQMEMFKRIKAFKKIKNNL